MSTPERGGRKKVKLIKINTPSEPAVVLATAHPSRDQQRGRVVSESIAPADEQSTIDTPLPDREQTILSHRVSQAVRQILNGFGRLPLPAPPGAATQSMDVTIGHKHITATTAPIAHASPSDLETDGAMELRLRSCQAIADVSTITNPITGRTLR